MAVLGRRRRDGRLHLLLAPPNADPVLVPADWTDFGQDAAEPERPRTTASQPASLSPSRLGAITDLLQLRAVVDGLLRSPAEAGAGHQQPIGTEGTGAIDPELPSDPTAGEPVDPAHRGTACRTRRRAGADHHQSRRQGARERAGDSIASRQGAKS